MSNKIYMLRKTPSPLLVLAAGFVMASSSNVQAALGMGVAVVLTLLLSSIVISAISKIIPNMAKLPAYVLIITGFVTLIDMLMQAHFPEIVDMHGVHLACLAVSAVAFRDAEEVAGCHGEFESITVSLVTGGFLTAIMVICAIIREFFGSASIFGINVAFMNDYKISALAGAFGGYLVLAIILAAIRKLGAVINKNKEEK
jgi:electron transport complex protein RnfE